MLQAGPGLETLSACFAPPTHILAGHCHPTSLSTCRNAPAYNADGCTRHSIIDKRSQLQLRMKSTCGKFDRVSVDSVGLERVHGSEKRGIKGNRMLPSLKSMGRVLAGLLGFLALHTQSILFSPPLFPPPGTGGMVPMVLLLLSLGAWKLKNSLVPTSEQILADAPPRCTLPEACKGDIKLPSGRTVHTDELAAEIQTLVSEQIGSGRQIGMSVSVYFLGKEVASVVGGLYRNVQGSGWLPVERGTKFMSYSTCKGVSGTALLTAVDRGECSYGDRVANYWPEYAKHGKENQTIATAISHRGGMPGFWPSVIVKLSMMKFWGWQQAWNSGLNMIEEYKPEWEEGTEARYHSTSWAFIMGGIVEKVTGSNVATLVRERIARPLDLESEMFLGFLPEEYWDTTALLEAPRTYGKGKDGKMKTRVLSALEAVSAIFIGNTKSWRRVSLPSSNGYFTSNAVARMYAALCNDGKLASGERLVSSIAVNAMVNTISDDSLHVPSKGKAPARLSLGFSPWVDEGIHGAQRDVLCHNGMGGCMGWGLPKSGLSLCIMKNAYEPYSWNGRSSTPDTVEMSVRIKKFLDVE